MANKANAAEVKEPSVSETKTIPDDVSQTKTIPDNVSQTKTIPDELVQIQAFIRWEKAGKPNYSPEEQLVTL